LAITDFSCDFAPKKLRFCCIAINKDPDAPIFSVADFGIVREIFTVLLVVIAVVKKIQAER